jgi:hypothetical protein
MSAAQVSGGSPREHLLKANCSRADGSIRHLSREPEILRIVPRNFIAMCSHERQQKDNARARLC